jgi:hypothetical protein
LCCPMPRSSRRACQSARGASRRGQATPPGTPAGHHPNVSNSLEAECGCAPAPGLCRPSEAWMLSGRRTTSGRPRPGT